MVNVQKVYDTFVEQGVRFFAGVPDSLLKDICAYITDHTSIQNHLITANEGTAIGVAAGYHLSTGELPLVYMQNSGIGNAVNPLLSLMDKKVYQMPLLLMVGWRGEPGTKDEPQHKKQGEVTLSLFDAMQIPYVILDENEETALQQIKESVHAARENSTPQALIIRKDVFGKYKLQTCIPNVSPLSREEALKIVVNQLNESDVIVSTTGKLSRELFEYRESLQQGHDKDFLTVGSMGHSSSIALGIALQKPERIVYCLDGDGAFIMHMGALTNIGYLSPKNYRHIVFNNGAHESVGAQPTIARQIDIPAIAKACGYKATIQATNEDELKTTLSTIQDTEGPVLLEIQVGINSRDDLGRPTTTPIENKNNFMKNLK